MWRGRGSIGALTGGDHPVITGATGRERIFDGDPDVALELVQSRTCDGRLQLLEYLATVLDGPPLAHQAGT